MKKDRIENHEQRGNSKGAKVRLCEDHAQRCVADLLSDSMDSCHHLLR